MHRSIEALSRGVCRVRFPLHLKLMQDEPILPNLTISDNDVASFRKALAASSVLEHEYSDKEVREMAGNLLRFGYIVEKQLRSLRLRQ